MTAPVPPYPVGRYGGRPHRLGRVAGRAAVAALALAALLWVGWAAWLHATPPVRGTLVGWRVTSDAAVSLRLEVTRDPAAGAVCTVRARNREGVEVGRADVAVPRGGPRSRALDYRLATRDRAVLAELESCRLGDTG